MKPSAKPSPEGKPTIRRYRAVDLISDGPWAVIEQQGDEYRLRITRHGKLILNK